MAGAPVAEAGFAESRAPKKREEERGKGEKERKEEKEGRKRIKENKKEITLTFPPAPSPSPPSYTVGGDAPSPHREYPLGQDTMNEGAQHDRSNSPSPRIFLKDAPTGPQVTTRRRRTRSHADDSASQRCRATPPGPTARTTATTRSRCAVRSRKDAHGMNPGPEHGSTRRIGIPGPPGSAPATPAGASTTAPPRHLPRRASR